MAISLEEMERRHIENRLIRKLHMRKEDVDRLFEIRSNIAARKIYGFYKRRSVIKEAELIEFLNKEMSHYLLVGADDWKDVRKADRYKVSDNEWWDIRVLLAYITQNLNFTDMGEPKPRFPSNPFTRDRYTLKELRSIYQKSKELNIELDISLDRFFNMKIKRALKHQNCEDKGKDPKNILTELIISRFRDNLRFQIVNSKDSQDNHMGHWVDKNKPFTDFEKVYNEWNEKSPFIYDDMDVLIPNPEKQFFKDILSHIPSENWSVYDLYLF